VRHARAIVLLPGVVAGLVPALLAVGGDVHVGWGLPTWIAWLPATAGVALALVGLFMIAWTVWLFARVGSGTLAPWDPTSRLVVVGPYRHVRNPMISGVLLLLLGEAALLGSIPVLVWFGCVLAVNAVYLPLVEEPALTRRFGSDYERYRVSVPRWLPRPRAWDPQDGHLNP
jgi:protein-S-isoprenylcysteine O-methyltransferase Ste14